MKKGDNPTPEAELGGGDGSIGTQTGEASRRLHAKTKILLLCSIGLAEATEAGTIAL